MQERQVVVLAVLFMSAIGGLTADDVVIKSKDTSARTGRTHSESRTSNLSVDACASACSGASYDGNNPSMPVNTDDINKGLASAREKQVQRQPAEAIALYRKVVEQSRELLEYSAPALVQMVECFQLLKGDEKAEGQYAELMGKYLTKPVPLDGKSSLSLDQAKEDLIWKPWPNVSPATQGANGAYTQTVAVGRWHLEIKDIAKIKDGKGDTALSLSLRLAGDSGREPFGFSASPPKARVLDFIAVGPDGKEYRPDPDSDSTSFAEHWFYDASTRIPKVPKTVSRLSRIRGRIQVVHPKTEESADLPLRSGASGKAGNLTLTLQSVKIDPKARTITGECEYERTEVKGFPDGWGEAYDRSGGFGLPSLRLGAETSSTSASMNEDDSNGEKSTRFMFGYDKSGAAPTRLVMESVSEVSCKEFSFELKDVELP